MANTWLSAVAEADAHEDQLSDPFAIVTDPAKRRKTEAPGGYKDNPTTNGPPTLDAEGDKMTKFVISSQPSPQTQQPSRNQGAAVGSQSSNNKQVRALRDIVGSNPTSKPNTYYSTVIAM